MANGGDDGDGRPAAARKRFSTTSIMDFFQRKRPHGARVVVDEEDEAVEAQLPPEVAVAAAGYAVEAIDSDDENEADAESEGVVTVVEAGRGDLLGIRKQHRDDRSSVMSLLSRRELGECGGRAPHRRGNPRRRLSQLVSRWVLGTFRCSPVKLSLSADWEQRGGRLRNEEFYASCVEFDSAGVLLAAGSSNGIIAIYDFDEYAHRSINAGHRGMQARHDQSTGDVEMSEELEQMHPIHTIFTPFEVQCIRWNPMNEASTDEIACSFSNRNEIWLFNLRKFPTRPTRVLKSSSHTSRGYNSLVFVSKKSSISSAAPPTLKPPQKAASHSCCVVAGDTVGAIRMWDVAFPNRPIWSISMGPHPINSIVLSRSKREIICGSQSGVIAIYDVHDVGIRAFGSKPAPLRKAVLSATDAIKPHMVHDPALFQSLHQWPGGTGIVSLRLLPQSANQVMCQLRNDWLVTLDLLKGVAVKLFTRKIELGRRGDQRDSKPKALPMSVLATPRELEMPITTVRINPTSWLGCHRCPATLLFDATVACWGPHGRLSIDTVDLSERSSTLIERATPAPESNATAADWTDRTAAGDVPSGWLRLPTSGPVTAVTGHPKQHIVVCGGANMELMVLGSFGRQDS